MNHLRVVVTGLGIVSPIGNRLKDAWDSAVNGRSGVGQISGFSRDDLPVSIAAEVKNFDPGPVVPPKERKRTTRFVSFALAAAQEAIEMSGICQGDDLDEVGVSIGVGLGGLQDIEVNTQILDNKGARKISPFFMPYTIANMASGMVSIKFGLGGPNICPTTACASGTHGIGEAFHYIRSGLARAMVCGGAEATISPLGIAAFTALKALSTRNDDPASASRPFDKERDGFVMGEGAGVLILEELDQARKRGAEILAEVEGFGMSGDGYHLTAPSPRGLGGQRCMKMALAMGNHLFDKVDYINAHGTSTKLNDLYESQAIMEVFGSRLSSLSVSSTKGVTGHCIGAAGGIEGVLSVASLMNQVVPPTANCVESDISCSLDYTPMEAKERKIEAVLSNSFGFGGTNASVIFSRFKG